MNRSLRADRRNNIRRLRNSCRAGNRHSSGRVDAAAPGADASVGVRLELLRKDGHGTLDGEADDGDEGHVSVGSRASGRDGDNVGDGGIGDLGRGDAGDELGGGPGMG